MLARRLDAFDEHTLPLLERLRGGGVVHDVPVAAADDEPGLARFELAGETWAAVQAACGLEVWRDDDD